MKRMFEFKYNLRTDALPFMKDIQKIMQSPYSLCFSCFFAYVQVSSGTDDTMTDPQYDPDGSLAAGLVIVNEIITNIIFNAGYMYQDIINYLKMTNETKDYYKNVGYYAGDFVVRIFWRNKFLTNFKYKTVTACP